MWAQRANKTCESRHYWRVPWKSTMKQRVAPYWAHFIRKIRSAAKIGPFGKGAASLNLQLYFCIPQIWIKHRPKPCLYCFHYSVYANLYYCNVRAHNELRELSFTLQERMGGVGWVRPFRLFQLLKNLRCLKTKAGVFPSLFLTDPIHLLCAVFQIPWIDTCTHTCVHQDKGEWGGNVGNTSHV